MKIYTIGHSNHTKDYFISLLRQAHIELVADIRALPRSRWAPWSAKGVIESHLREAGIEYRWMGGALGGKPSLKKDRAHKVTAADFAGMDERPSYKEGIKELMALAARQRTCLMCSEEDPARCHRELLVGETLRREGVEVVHVRGNLKLKTQNLKP